MKSIFFKIEICFFKACGLFISDSSRQRTWHEWLSKSDYAIQGDLGILYEHFQAIANAYNEEVLHEAALHLENSEVWRSCASLRSWFNSKWLLEAKVRESFIESIIVQLQFIDVKF